jgi:hypothetical protein
MAAAMTHPGFFSKPPFFSKCVDWNPCTRMLLAFFE